MLKRIFPIIILLLLSCEVDKNNKPKPVESVSSLSSPIPISTPIVTSSVTPIVSPSNLQPSPSPSWDCTFRTPDDLGIFRENRLDQLRGIIKDRNNNPLKDATIDVTVELKYNLTLDLKDNSTLPFKCDTYYLKFQTKTDENGKYEFDKFFSMKVNFVVSKKGWTTRTFIGFADYLHCYGTISFSNDDNCSKDGAILPQDEPEINQTIINQKKVDYNLLFKFFKEEDIVNHKVKEDSLLSGLEVINTNNIEVELYFSESIKKETVENNIYIVSVEDPSYIIDKKGSNFFMSWSEDDTKLKLNFKLNKTGKYRISFKDGFQDLNSNKSFDKRYFRVSTGDQFAFFLQNILFEYKN